MQQQQAVEMPMCICRGTHTSQVDVIILEAACGFGGLQTGEENQQQKIRTRDHLYSANSEKQAFEVT